MNERGDICMKSLFGSAKRAIAKVTQAAKKVAKQVVSIAKTTGKRVVKAVTSAAKGIASGASKTIRAISSGIKVLVPWIKQKVVQSIGFIAKVVGNLYRKFWGDGVNQFCVLWDSFIGIIRGKNVSGGINSNPLKVVGKYLAEIFFDKYYKVMPEPLEKFAEETFLFGFRYDDEQNITYTMPDAPQKYAGYTPIYDLASRDVGYDIAAQIITFTYGEKEYMIETWKGDYWGAAGCEVGIYSRKSGYFKTDKYFYDCGVNDQMYMTSKLKSHSRTIFERKDTHWWLTGFSPCEYLKPEELDMEISITFENQKMAKAFKRVLRDYHTAVIDQIGSEGCTVKWFWYANNTDSIEKTVADYLKVNEITDELYDELMSNTLDELMYRNGIVVQN